jgi:hypothetical protein
LNGIPIFAKRTHLENLGKANNSMVKSGFPGDQALRQNDQNEPDQRDREWVSPEERKARLREIFGRSPKTPEPPVAAVPAASGSNPVKPSQTKSDPIQPVKPVESEVGGLSGP